ncbi:MAG: DNA recombination protein RmuC, partial [Rhodosalinus sp.]
MIEIGGRALSLQDPGVLAVLGGAALTLLVLLLLVSTARAAGRAARVAAPLAAEMDRLGRQVQALSDGQQRL